MATPDATREDARTHPTHESEVFLAGVGIVLTLREIQVCIPASKCGEKPQVLFRTSRIDFVRGAPGTSSKEIVDTVRLVLLSVT